MKDLKDCARTPRAFFEAVSKRYGPFDLDAAADDANKLCEGALYEALTGPPWAAFGERIWCNPPYSKPNIPKFIGRALQAAAASGVLRIQRVVMLLPANIGSSWFRMLTNHALVSKIWLVSPRLNFEAPIGWNALVSEGKAKPWGGARHPSMLAVLEPWNGKSERPRIGMALWDAKAGKINWVD